MRTVGQGRRPLHPGRGLHRHQPAPCLPADGQQRPLDAAPVGLPGAGPALRAGATRCRRDHDARRAELPSRPRAGRTCVGAGPGGCGWPRLAI